MASCDDRPEILDGQKLMNQSIALIDHQQFPIARPGFLARYCSWKILKGWIFSGSGIVAEAVPEVMPLWLTVAMAVAVAVLLWLLLVCDAHNIAARLTTFFSRMCFVFSVGCHGLATQFQTVGCLAYSILRL